MACPKFGLCVQYSSRGEPALFISLLGEWEEPLLQAKEEIRPTFVILSLDPELEGSLSIEVSLLKENPPPGADIGVIGCDTEDAAISSLAQLARQQTLPVLLVDMSPDSRFDTGTVARMAQEFPEVPVVAAVPGNRDGLEYEALCAGACDYFVKGAITPSIFTRILISSSNYRSAKRLAYEKPGTAKALAEAIPMAIMVVDRRGTIIGGWNPAAERIFGPGRDGALQKPMPRVRWTGKEETEAILEKAASGHPISGIEVQCQRADGKWIDAIAFFTPLYEGDELQGILVLFEDITRRKETENALRDSEVRFRGVFERSQIGMAIVDSNIRITQANSALGEMFGYPAEELAGAMADQLIHPEDRPDVATRMSRLLRDRISFFTSENRYMRADGGMFVGRLLATLFSIGPEGPHYVLFALEDITLRKMADEKLEASLAKLRETTRGAIHAMARVVEMRDPYTAGHQERVAYLARRIATELGHPEDVVDGIYFGSLVHDIGKIVVPGEILTKPGRLSPIEFALIKAHPEEGFRVVSSIDFPWPIADMVLEHHERLDGSGYPAGLTGDEICEGARIVAVADVVEAMSSHRPYRPSLGIDAALDEITGNSGILYDSEVVRACTKVIAKHGRLALDGVMV